MAAGPVRPTTGKIETDWGTVAVWLYRQWSLDAQFLYRQWSLDAQFLYGQWSLDAQFLYGTDYWQKKDKRLDMSLTFGKEVV